MIDWLIWQGYGMEAVYKMTLRQLDLFAEKSNQRFKAMYGAGDGKTSKGTPKQF